jgi:hypothetical protein
LPQIETPSIAEEKITSISDFLREITKWQETQNASALTGFAGQLWYRGVNTIFPNQVPGVYRSGFTERARELYSGNYKDIEDCRLRLEREMLSQFRTSGASFLRNYSPVEVYFAAQHFGLPTRLLDWSTNPLAALFFACDGQAENDGVIYAMDARQMIAPGAMKNDAEKLYQAVMTMRHMFVRAAVDVSMWAQLRKDVVPHVLPVRPDSVPGRIGQQSSCFTFHMHRSKPAANATLVCFRIEASHKDRMRVELHRLNINQFTTYYDLDHLSREIRASWGVH